MPLKEIDRETRERAEFTTKPLHCPDGVTRIVTMSGWHWHNYEWLLRHNYRESDRIVPWILDYIRENDCAEMSDEERFCAMLQGCIFQCMRVLFPHYNIGHPDNDNTRPAGSAVQGDVAPGGDRRALRLYLGRGGRIGQLPA